MFTVLNPVSVLLQLCLWIYKCKFQGQCSEKYSKEIPDLGFRAEALNPTKP